MTADCKAALTYGKLIRKQMFDTPKGCYQILLVRRKGQVYFFKYHNSKLVEASNLSQLPGTPMADILKGEAT